MHLQSQVEPNHEAVSAAVCDENIPTPMSVHHRPCPFVQNIVYVTEYRIFASLRSNATIHFWWYCSELKEHSSISGLEKWPSGLSYCYPFQLPLFQVHTT